ncbi:MAG: response regulator [Pseudomonadota bacterium]
MTKRVLLVEDEPNIVESLRFLLGRAGFDVDVQGNGREGLAAARTTPPDVLILDVMLPEINGLEVLRALRADEAGQDLPVLMLTAKGQREDRDRAIEAGADIFLTKPFANADLISVVETLASGRPG